ncbi:Ribonuclease T2 [Merluccius polli]|uniref:Ribonuclease T2 n=1 Tax=Merluccius polli TaxID=89951 RepID=A0AA47MRI7_MERPO|nr:Ribonuclease T2 [Merluccius polli]
MNSGSRCEAFCPFNRSNKVSAVMDSCSSQAPPHYRSLQPISRQLQHEPTHLFQHAVFNVYRMSLLPLLVLLGAVVHSWQQGDLWPSPDHQNDYKYRHFVDEPDNECSWQCLKFTLQWPGTFCLYIQKSTSECQIPLDINTWTIHGLWPQKVDNCCRCWNLFPSDLQDLQEELSKEWPSFLKFVPAFNFWRLEWLKHGSCAACVEGFNSPLQYFSISLKLRQHFNITRALSEGGVTPSCDRPYKLAELQRVLTPLLGDKYEIQCITDHQDRELWFQVKIPLSRNLTLGCAADLQDHQGPHPVPGHLCQRQAPIYLLPIDHQDPLHPSVEASPSPSPSVVQASQEPEVEDLQLSIQLHADDAVVSVDTEEDTRRLAVLPQNHLHLGT